MSGFDLGGVQGAVGRPVPLLGESGPRALPDGGERKAFGGALADAIGEVDALQDAVRGKYQKLASGETVELHDLMSAMGKSEVAFNLLLEVKNRLVDAWDKLSRSVV